MIGVVTPECDCNNNACVGRDAVVDAVAGFAIDVDAVGGDVDAYRADVRAVDANVVGGAVVVHVVVHVFVADIVGDVDYANDVVDVADYVGIAVDDDVVAGYDDYVVGVGACYVVVDNAGANAVDSCC